MTAKELLSECCHSCHSKNACDHVRTLSYAVIRCHTVSDGISEGDQACLGSRGTRECECI